MPQRFLRTLGDAKVPIPFRVILAVVACNSSALIGIFLGGYIVTAWALPGAVRDSFTKEPDLLGALWGGLCCITGVVRLASALISSHKMQIRAALCSVLIWLWIAVSVAAAKPWDIGVPIFIILAVADLYAATSLAYDIHTASKEGLIQDEA
jgi:hypothetical protein